MLGVASISWPVDASERVYLDYVVPFRALLSQDVCMKTQLMKGSSSIPFFEALYGVFSPVKILNGNKDPVAYENINLLTENGGINYQYISDNYINGVFEYKLSIDMSAVNTSNGTTTQGRQRTVTMAKLAIISIVKTAEAVNRESNFKIWIKVDGLPKQTGLTGFPVLTMQDTTQESGAEWPYTSSSKQVQHYINDVIAKECRSSWSAG